MFELAADSDSILAIATLIGAIAALVWVCRRDPRQEHGWLRTVAGVIKHVFPRKRDLIDVTPRKSINTELPETTASRDRAPVGEDVT